MLFVTHDIEEVIFIADRVVVMTPRPARVADEFIVPFEFPRSLEVRSSPEFQKMRVDISRLLTEQIAS